MRSWVKGAAVGLAWFVGYMIFTKAVIVPAAKKYGVPLVRDL